MQDFNPSPSAPSAPTLITPDQTCVVIPMPGPPPGIVLRPNMPPTWGMFDRIPPSVTIYIVDDTLYGSLAPPIEFLMAHPKTTIFTRQAMSRLVPFANTWQGSAACRNYGHLMAYDAGFECIIALDYDCVPPPNFIEQHLSSLNTTSHHVEHGPIARNNWVNPIDDHTANTYYSRGFPYEHRVPNIPPGQYTTSYTRTPSLTHTVLNMGLWSHILDINGIDKLDPTPDKQPPIHPPYLANTNRILAQHPKAKLPLCGMNTAFRRELTPAYFFIPNITISPRFTLSRHDDIWGGYVLSSLMPYANQTHHISYGHPVVTHLKQTPLPRVTTYEHYMHLLSPYFYDLIDNANNLHTHALTTSYHLLFNQLLNILPTALARPTAPIPPHYVHILSTVVAHMKNWSSLFTILAQHPHALPTPTPTPT